MAKRLKRAEKLLADLLSGVVPQVGPDQYILDAQGEPVQCLNFYEWAMWMEEHRDERIIAKDRDEGQHALDVEVSTIFIGLDHRWSNVTGEEAGPPILWETMIFAEAVPDLHLNRWRYTSRAEALAGHQEACLHVSAVLATRKES